VNAQELKTKIALEFMGFTELREISQSELDLSFKVKSHKYNPETCTNEKYKDGKDYLLLLEYYNYLSDIKRTNETIRNIINPDEKTYQYQDEKPKVEDEFKDGLFKEEDFINDSNTTNNSNQEFNEAPKPQYVNVQVVDRPRIWIIIISLLIPLFGIIMFALSKPLTPKAAKWYLIFAIIGFIINLILEIFLFPMLYQSMPL